MRNVQAIGWDWTDEGAVITLVVDGAVAQWLIPLGHVRVEFGRELARVGCPLQPSVGDPSVGGFFDSISSAVKSASRAVKKAVPKAITRATSSVARLAEQGARAVSRQAKSYGRNLASVAQRAVRDPRQLGLAALTGGASLAAQSNLHRDVLSLARHVPGPIGSAATANLAINRALSSAAQGQRIDAGGLVKGLAQAGASYVPGGSALTSTPLGRAALSTGLGLAQGQRLDRALKGAVMREAKIPGLDLLPGSKALAEAHRAWGNLNRGRLAELARGRGLPVDPRLLKRAAETRRAVKRTAAQARAGNRKARELMAAVRRVGACL
jgi:hypothetical protein